MTAPCPSDCWICLACRIGKQATIGAGASSKDAKDEEQEVVVTRAAGTRPEGALPIRKRKRAMYLQGLSKLPQKVAHWPAPFGGRQL